MVDKHLIEEAYYLIAVGPETVKELGYKSMGIVFDIEIALLFPWAAVFRDMVREGNGWLAFLEVASFLVVLMGGFAFVWAKGDLDWTGPGSPSAMTAPGLDEMASPTPVTQGPVAGAPREDAIAAR